MENLNAEQVKKALECYSEKPLISECEKGCVYYEKYNGFSTCCLPIEDVIIKNALALINSQEQRIGELATELEAMRGAANSYKMYSKTLEDENKKLRALVDEGFDTENSLNGKIKELTEENEKLWKASKHLAQIVVGAAVVDQIAKEMLEGEK